MAVKDTTQLNLIAENKLVEEQRNLLKEIGKELDTHQAVYSKIGSNISKDIKNLTQTTDLQEQINKSKSIGQKINIAINKLTIQESSLSQKLLAAANTHNNFQVKMISGKIKQNKLEQDRLNIINKQIQSLSQITPLLLKQDQLLGNLSRKAKMADVLGFSKHTSGITTVFNKIALLFGNNQKAANKVLSILNNFYYPIVAFYVILSKAYGIFKEMDEAFFKFRKQWGLVREDSKQFEERMFRIVKNTAHLGVNFDDVIESTTKLGKESGNLLSVTDEMIQNVSILNKQFGILVDVSTKFLKVMASSSQQTIGAQTGILGVAKAMSNAAKVPLNDVMDDIARASASSYGYLSRSPIQLIKAAVEARRFGSSLSSLTATSKSLLGFTESIESEMEASVLLGRGLNLQYARELAFHKDFVGLNKEIVKLAKEYNFNQMDQFQAAAFAKSLGKSEEELGKILQSSEEQNNLMVRANDLVKKGDKSLLNQINNRNKILKASEEELKILGKKEEKDFINLRNQERLSAITDRWKQIFIEISEIFLPFIEKSLQGITFLIDHIRTVIQATKTITIYTRGWIVSLAKGYSIFKSIGKSLSVLLPWLKTLGKFSGILNIMFAIWNVIKAIKNGIGDIMDGIKEGNVGKIIHGLFKSTIGAALGALEGLFGFVVDIPLLLLKGIASIGPQWLKTFSKMADDIWISFKDFLGFSPSQLGLSIVNGIESVGMMLFSVLTSPFKLAWDFFKNTAIQIGPMFLNAVGSIGGMMFNNITAPFKKAWDWISGLFGGGKNNQPTLEKSVVKSKSLSLEVPIDRPLTNKEIKSYKELDTVSQNNVTIKPSKETVEQKSDSFVEMQSAILAELKALNSNLMSGKIAVNMDSQLVSTTIGRNVRFRGEFGAIVG